MPEGSEELLVQRTRASRILDRLLNAYLAGLALVLLTGGFVYRSPRLTLDVAAPSGWVLGLLCLLALRRGLARGGHLSPLAGARLLGALGDRLATAPIVLAGIITGATALLIAVAVRRHWAFQSGGFDLGIFDQALWNTAHGRWLFSSIKGGIVLLGDHFDPFQLILVPVYRIVPSPLILLAAQGLALGLGALPLYWLARARFPGSVLTVLFPILYVLYLPLRSANRANYHPTAFVPALLLFALYFMERGWWRSMVTVLVLAGLCKENMPAAGMAVGLYLLVTGRQRRLGIALSVGFAVWLAAGILWIIPAFNPGGYAYFDRYQLAGGSWPTRGRLIYLGYLLGPVAFLPLLAPARLLLALPFLAQNLLSTSPAQISIYQHYALELVPFVFYAALGGAAYLLGRLGVLVGRASDHHGLAAVLLVASLLFHGRPESWYVRQYQRTPHLEILAAQVRAVPADVAVSTQNVIAPHLTHREFMYLFPDLGPGTPGRAEYVILDRTLDPWPAGAAFTDQIASLPGQGYTLAVDEQGILVFRRVPR